MLHIFPIRATRGCSAGSAVSQTGRFSESCTSIFIFRETGISFYETMKISVNNNPPSIISSSQSVLQVDKSEFPDLIPSPIEQ
jgi:hypothetical protein